MTQIETSQQTKHRHQIIANLIALAHLDTLYRDLYHGWARNRLQADMTDDSYRTLKHELVTLANLPNQIRNAMASSAWGKVGDLSKQYRFLSHLVEKKQRVHEFAQEIYDNRDVPIDPFSPGMSTIPGVAVHELAVLKTEARRFLNELCVIDAQWGDFYRQRLKAFDGLQVDRETQSSPVHPSTSQLENDAFEALDGGKFDALERLAEALVENTNGHVSASDDVNQTTSEDNRQNYTCDFAPEVVKQAQVFGLERCRVPDRHREFEPYCHFAWHPTFAQMHGEHSSVLQIPDLPLPAGTPDAMVSRIQLFATHPMINSGGVRFLPSMVAEDVLVETFEEPSEDMPLPKSRLLEALGLLQRNQLSRLQIETALLTRGNTFLQDELGLDPVEFKLVCIPPDLHLRLGLERNWGQQKIWTHFDGYMVMMDGSLRALAGGDVRYGGIYDLLGIARNYDSNRIIVRFAIVQRRRMALWQDLSMTTVDSAPMLPQRHV